MGNVNILNHGFELRGEGFADYIDIVDVKGKIRIPLNILRCEHGKHHTVPLTN